MPPSYFSADGHSQVFQNTGRPRFNSPYASTAGSRSLTQKERAARVQNKQARGQGGLRVASMGSGGGNTVQAGSQGFFSPQVGPDFLELPQSIQERREIYRHFYENDPIVNSAINLHTELPLSKLRLARPKPTTCPEGFDSPDDYGHYILDFYQEMVKRTKLFQKLVTAVHHMWLDGSCYIFMEDSAVDVPFEVGHRVEKRRQSVITDEGEAVERDEEVEVELPDGEERELAYYRKEYLGWDRIVILPIDRVDVRTYNFTDKIKVSLIPSDRDKELLEQAEQGDPIAEEMIQEIPEEVREYLAKGEMIPLNTDPDKGSFVYEFSGRKSADGEPGLSILQSCLRTLYYREKLRQAQTQIASRAMTPKRIVWAEGLSDVDTDDLREQVDLALVDPDYSIVTNYEVHWEEMGSKDRLLDLTSEYETTTGELYAGLGVTASLLTGEGLFSGDRMKLEVINTRYMLLREFVQEFVEENIFRPIALRKGFVEKNKWGRDVPLYPKLSFTRLALKDSQDLFDILINLYQKGSVSIDLILELFNIDPVDTREKLEKDLLTVNDANFNEVTRALYSELGRMMAEKSDALERVTKYMKMEMKPDAEAPEEPGRFG